MKEDVLFVTTEEMLRPGFCGVLSQSNSGEVKPGRTLDMSKDAKLIGGAKMKFPAGFTKTYEDGDSLWVFAPELAADIKRRNFLSEEGWFYGADGRLYTFNKESNFEAFQRILEDVYSSDIRLFVLKNRDAQAKESLALLKLLVGNKNSKALLLSEARIEYGRMGVAGKDKLLQKYAGLGINEEDLQDAFKDTRKGVRFYKMISWGGKALLVLVLMLMVAAGVYMFIK